MDITLINQLIGNLGFPIVCVLAMFYLQIKERESHRSEMEEITKAVNNNTIILQRLLEKLDEGEVQVYEGD